MNRNLKKVQFGNCNKCAGYSKLDRESLCPKCAVEMLDLLEEAVRCTQKNPDITIDEIAQHLEISLEQVNEWVRQGKLRCVSIRFTCPTCQREITNKLICSYCGYTVELTPICEEKPKLRSVLMETVLEERFSKERKHPTYRHRLLSSLPGFLKSHSSDA